MVNRHRMLIVTFLVVATANSAARDLVVETSAGAHYGVPLTDMYYPWFACSPPYRCGDPAQMRLELERARRMQELRERAMPPEPRRYEAGDGPWGRQPYMPPPTPAANIQPAYRGSSQLRPEYEQTGRPIGDHGTDARFDETR